MQELEILKKTEIKYRILAFILPPLLVMVSGILVNLASANIKHITTKRQELLTQEQVVQETTAFNNYLVANQSQLSQLNLVVPSEAMMIAVIQDFEAIVSEFDPQGSVQITSAAPARVGTNLAVSLMIKSQTSLDDLPNLLEAIKQLPYVHQLLSIDTNQAGELYTHQLSLRLYVQDPFNTP